MAITIKFKRGDKAVWEKLNLVLAPGEPGFELDTGKLKIGNGKIAWNDLPYINGSGSLSPDKESLAVEQDGVLSIYGYKDATIGQIPIKTEKGLSWISLSEVAKTGDISDLTQRETIELYGGAAPITEVI